jgi:hypothetical protein
MIIKERFEEALNGVKAQITLDMRQKKDKPFTDRMSPLSTQADVSQILYLRFGKDELGRWSQTGLLPRDW